MGTPTKLRGRAAVIGIACAGALLIGGTAAAATTLPSKPPTSAPHHRSGPFGGRGFAFLTGKVSNAGSGSFTLTESGRKTVAVDVNGSTTYSESGTKTAPSGVADGDRVTVLPTKGTSSTATTVTASHVSIDLAQVSGTVGTVGASSFPVSTPGGLVTTVDVSGSTVYTKDGATVSGVTDGEQVTTFGTPGTSDPSQLDARFVNVRAPQTRTGPFGGRGFGFAFLTGKVSNAGSGSFTLTESGRKTVAVDVNGSTTYSESGTKTAPSGVADGDRVTVLPTKGTSSTATTVTASHVSIDLAQVSGTVGTVGASSFPVSTPGGLVTTVDVSGSTVYTKDGATVSGVTDGEQVTTFGTPGTSDPSQLDARFVNVRAPQTRTGPFGGRGFGGPNSGASGVPGPSGFGGFPSGGQKDGPGGSHAPFGLVAGKVTSVQGEDITVAPSSGSPRTVVVSSSTKYLGAGGSGGLSAVKNGNTVTAFGTSTSSGDLDATLVFLGSFPAGHPGGTPPASTFGGTDRPAPSSPWPGSSGSSAPPWGGRGGGTTNSSGPTSAPSSGGPSGPRGDPAGGSGPGGWH